jgi:hypothetical protein
VHVTEDRTTEWFFRRNPVVQNRVSGIKIDHRARTLIAYDESDLRNLLGINGWGAIVSLGFDHGQLSKAVATGAQNRVGDVVFEEYRSANGSFSWSAEAGLATDFSTPGAGTGGRVSIVAAAKGVDASLLREPSLRFPAYAVRDVAEWLEHPARSHSR